MRCLCFVWARNVCTKCLQNLSCCAWVSIWFVLWKALDLSESHFGDAKKFISMSSDCHHVKLVPYYRIYCNLQPLIRANSTQTHTHSHTNTLTYEHTHTQTQAHQIMYRNQIHTLFRVCWLIDEKKQEKKIYNWKCRTILHIDKLLNSPIDSHMYALKHWPTKKPEKCMPHNKLCAHWERKKKLCSSKIIANCADCTITSSVRHGLVCAFGFAEKRTLPNIVHFVNASQNRIKTVTVTIHLRLHGWCVCVCVFDFLGVIRCVYVITHTEW